VDYLIVNPEKEEIKLQHFKEISQGGSTND